MAIQEISPSGSISGRIGKGFAQGLSEQLPKEIERQRLSSGLRDLGKQDLGNKSVFDQLAAIHGIPGMTPQLAEQAQQQIQKSRFFGPQTSPSSPMAPGEANQVPPGRTNAPLSAGESTTPVLSEKSSNYGIQASGPEIENIAKKMYQENPNRFARPEDYLQYAQQQDDKRVVKEQQFEKRQGEANDFFDKGLQEITHKNGKEVFKDLNGTTIRDFKNRMNQKIDAGISPRRASDETLKEILPLVHANNDVQQASEFLNRTMAGPTKTRERIENARKVFEKNGQLPIFRDELVATGMNPGYADYITYPVKEDKAVNNIIASTKKAKPRNIISGTIEKGALGNSYAQGKDQEKLFDNIAQNLSNKSSLGATALALKGRGYDPEAFITYMTNLANEGKWEPNDRQARELREDSRYKPNMMDVFLFSKMGLDPIEVR